MPVKKNGEQSPKGFITLKELAELFYPDDSIKPESKKKFLKKELQKISDLNLQAQKMKRYFSPKEQEIIFNHLGNPLT